MRNPHQWDSLGLEYNRATVPRASRKSVLDRVGSVGILPVPEREEGDLLRVLPGKTKQNRKRKRGHDDTADVVFVDPGLLQQSPRLSVHARLGPLTLASTKGLKAGKIADSNENVVSSSNLSWKAILKLSNKYKNFPVKALRCFICKDLKINNVKFYFTHLNGARHKTRHSLYDMKSKAVLDVLKHDAKITQLLTFGKKWKPVSTKPCGICGVARGRSAEDHLSIKEFWTLHEYSRPSSCCEEGIFSNRSVYDQHRLTLEHMQKEYEFNEKLKKKFEAHQKKLDDAVKAGKPITGGRKVLGKIAWAAKVVSQFEDTPIPKEVNNLLSMSSKRDWATLQGKSLNNPGNHKSRYYDPSAPSGQTPVLFTTDFKCYLCGTIMGVDKESVIKHCSTKEHYDNILKKQQKLKEKVSESEKGDQELVEEEVPKQTSQEEDDANEEEEEVEDIDIYRDPYAEDELLEVIDRALDEDDIEDEDAEIEEDMIESEERVDKIEVDEELDFDGRDADIEAADIAALAEASSKTRQSSQPPQNVTAVGSSAKTRQSIQTSGKETEPLSTTPSQSDVKGRKTVPAVTEIPKAASAVENEGNTVTGSDAASVVSKKDEVTQSSAKEKSDELILDAVDAEEAVAELAATKGEDCAQIKSVKTRKAHTGIISVHSEPEDTNSSRTHPTNPSPGAVTKSALKGVESVKSTPVVAEERMEVDDLDAQKNLSKEEKDIQAEPLDDKSQSTEESVPAPPPSGSEAESGEQNRKESKSRPVLRKRRAKINF